MRGVLLTFLISCSFFLVLSPVSAHSEEALSDPPGFGEKLGGSSYFSSENILLPSSARELMEVVLVYKNIDGSLSEKRVKINKNIDWHYSISISQKDAMENIGKRYFSLYNYEFFIDGDSILVTPSSNNALKRHFILSAPLRIVMDYERSGSDQYNKKVGTQLKYFSSIAIGTHEDFDRVVLELDGQYRHDMTRQEGGYKILLK